MSKLAVLLALLSLAVAGVALYRTLPDQAKSEVGGTDRPLHRNRETAELSASLLNGCKATEEQLQQSYDVSREKLIAQIERSRRSGRVVIRDDVETPESQVDIISILAWAELDHEGQEVKMRVQAPCLASKIRELDNDSWRKLCGNLFEGLDDRKSFVSACRRANIPE